ncbi:MAG TPA: ABC transporter permease [Dongiaceae bacterium]|nr:ABC transporter permease [Dongiaceae bacterium]
MDRRMGAFALKRLGALIITMLAVSIMIFAAFEWTPGQVASKMLGPFATPEQIELKTKELGLDRPAPVRYVEWVGNVLHGNLGYSTYFKTDVNNVIWDRLGNTLILASLAFATIVPCSIFFGVLAGMREGTKLDRTISVLSIVTTSVPEFASGVFLATIFVILLGWLPGASTLDTSAGNSIAAQLVLPVAVMVLFDLGYVVRMVRASMVEVMTKPYIRTAILKGLSFRKVVMKHALRNAMVVSLTVILLQINYLVAGVVVVETIFAYPGFGHMILESALAKDTATVEAATLVTILITVVTQIVGDLGYMWLNPRIRFA